jgi:TBC1 domain family member 24
MAQQQQNDEAVDDLLQPTSLSEMVIGSIDTLRQQPIDFTSIPSTWNDKPPLLTPVDRRGNILPESDRLLKGMLRFGIPPPLRCAVQLSNVIQAVHPHHGATYWHEYRTLSKVRALDGAYENLLRTILFSQPTTSPTNSDTSAAAAASTTSDNSNRDYGAFGGGSEPSPTSELYAPLWRDVRVSNFGRPPDSEITTLIPAVTDQGRLALRRVAIALERVLGVSDFAPLLPALAAVLLCSMSESYTFCAIREMGHAVTWFFPTSKLEHAAWCLEDRGVLDVDGLAPILDDFFVGVLPFHCVQRVMDLYTLEGSKVLFRFGVALLVLYRKESAEQLITISNADEWWTTLRHWAHSSSSHRFDFELLVRKAYGVHGRGIRKQMRFPRRAILQRIIRMEEDRIRKSDTLDDEGKYREPPASPLGLVPPPPPSKSTEEPIRAILAQAIEARQYLAQWLPLTLRLTNLNLLYSTNYHGRTLERFYSHVQDTNHTILLCEVLLDGSNSGGAGQSSCTIGMYASQAWRASTRVYGDGACFLFRLSPEAQCWKWQPRHTGKGKLLDQVDLESDDSNNKIALLEQFMVGTRTMISMGGNPDGSSGFRLNEDLTRGESSRAVGFENEPLHGEGRGSVFEIGLVEVYGLVRQVDGRSV